MLLTAVTAQGLTQGAARVLAQGAEETHELPVEPMVFGVIAFAILGALMVGVLMFGKGRPHS